MSAGREVRPSRTLWFIDLDHESGMRHGGNLRWFTCSGRWWQPGRGMLRAK